LREPISVERGTSTGTHVNATVMEIVSGDNGAPHRIRVGSPEGFACYDARTLLLATGCYESPRDTILISGPRPAGLFTTESLQALVRSYGSKPGKRVIILGTEIVAYLRDNGTKTGRRISISAEDPFRYVVPQRILPEETKSYRSSLFQPGPSIQLSRTVKKGVLEAWSGSQVIWRKPFTGLIGSTRIPLPLDEFDWPKVDHATGVVLKVVTS
jgi:hypothetical protein